VQLFVRHGKSLTAVTPAGQHIIDHARLIMREVDDIRAVARGFIDEGRRTSMSRCTTNFRRWPRAHRRRTA
jgi:DNA-binding transcriptional LysR family regulator